MTRLSDERSSHDVDLAVIRDIARYLRRSEYIRIGGKPLLLVTGIDLAPRIYLAVVEPFDLPGDGASPRACGFDASVELPPDGVVAPEQARGRLINPRFRGRVCDYKGTAVAFAGQTLPGHTRFRGVMPAWDNTPQEQAEAVIFTGSSPGAYQAWLEHVVRQTREQNFGDERIIFINAWNNWAEGAYLEPDLPHGHAYLEATRNALDLLRLERP